MTHHLPLPIRAVIEPLNLLSLHIALPVQCLGWTEYRRFPDVKKCNSNQRALALKDSGPTRAHNIRK